MSSKKQEHAKQRSKSYGDFVRNLHLAALGLTRSSCQLNRDQYYGRIVGKKSNAARTISSNYKLGDVDEDFFDARASFKLTIQAKKAKAPDLVIECAFDAHFHGQSPIDRKMAERFIAADLRVVVWPYLRQFVYDITSRMVIPPVVVPLSVESQVLG